ncbi:hypothetical protein H4R21_004780, partial [Coemansia helicoidea]
QRDKYAMLGRDFGDGPVAIVVSDGAPSPAPSSEHISRAASPLPEPGREKLL